MRYVRIPKSPSSFHRRRSSWLLKKYKPILAITAVVIFIALAIALLSGSASVFNFAFPGATSLKNSDGRVNLLLLGNAGGIHDGAFLTDTVIMASLNLKTKHVYFISLPRDLWLVDEKIKLNAVYEVGKDKGDGLKFAKQIVGEILGLPIHYAIRIDFKGFVRAVDEVGGIDVSVEKGFDDYKYPIAGRENDLCSFKEEEREFNEEEAKKINIEPGKRKVLIDPEGRVATESADFPCRFDHISFEKGLARMDGETALKFVRSRMGTNGEGSDFARSKRQQKIIDAFRKKAFSLETLVNPKKISSLIQTFGRSFETDIQIDDMIELYKLSKEVVETSSFVLSSSGKDALLINPPPSDYGGAWVLVPKEGNFTRLQEYVKKILVGDIPDEATNSARTSNSGL